MSKIVKRVSPYRGIFVRRDRANTRKTYNEYFSKPHKYKKITVGKPIEERMLKRRRLVLDGEDTDSEYDENLFPEGFEAMPRDWKLSDLDEMRRKTREERFIPAICHVSQQKRSSIKLKKLLASNQSRRNEGMGIRSPHLQTRTIKERDEEDDDEEWSEDEFDEDDSNDDELSSEEEMYIGPEFYNKSLPVDVGPSTPKSSRPSGVRFAPTTPSTPIASVNPIAVTTTPPTIASPVATPASPVAAPTPASPPFTAPSLSPIIIPPPTPIPRVKKSLDEVFEDNYSMLMAIIPVVPLHFRKQVQKWLVKLVSMSENDKNKKNRNQHIGFMLQQLQTLELTAPFLKDPPSGTPRELGRTNNSFFLKWLATAQKVSLEEKLRKACKPLQIAQRLECKRPYAFLDDQPVPNMGMIAYGSCFSSYGQ